MNSQHRPRKRFGQNFLHDPGVIQRIVAAMRPQPGQSVVEIGPGLGALTAPLLRELGELDAVELDRDLPPRLQALCAGLGELRIHRGDALRFDFAGLRCTEQRLRVVGNLPYNIATPLLFHLLTQAESIADMHFMLQKEVAMRLSAVPGGAEYGRLSVMIQFHCQVESLFNVRPGAFKPVPKVDSTVVRLQPHRQPPVTVMDLADFAVVVAQAFAQRRKTLRNSLRSLLSASAIASTGVAPEARPQTLTVAEFAALSNYRIENAGTETHD